MFNYSKELSDKEKVESQYKDGKNLSKRISIHEKYSVNKQGLSNWLFEKYSFFEGYRVLELGCGTGDLWRDKIHTLPNSIEIILTDLTDGMVSEVADKFNGIEKVKVLKCDIQNIPFEDMYFDVVIANFMLYHVPNIDKALSEVHRVLKPKGIFYSATVGDRHMIEINRWIREFNEKLDIFNSSKLSFKLQNGAEYLEKFFSGIEVDEYVDDLEIEKVEDLIEYISSFKDMANISDEQKAQFTNYLENKKDENGIIKVSKQSGTFKSIKS